MPEGRGWGEFYLFSVTVRVSCGTYVENGREEITWMVCPKGENNIKIVRRRAGKAYTGCLSRGENKWKALVNTVINVRIA